MSRSTILSFAILVGCNPGSNFQARIVNGMTKEPVSGQRVLAKATPEAGDMTCEVREGMTDANGNVLIKNLCPDTTYALKMSDDTLLIANAPKVQGGEKQTAAVNLTVWRAPAGEGVFRLTGDELTPIRTFSDIKKSKAKGTGETIIYPAERPIKVPSIPPGSWLVEGGTNTISKLKFYPLIADHGTRHFEGEDGGLIDHVYAGVKFSSDTEYTRVEAKLDQSKFKDIKSGTRVVRYIPSDALPAGRYAIFGDKDLRMFVIDFGAPNGAGVAQSSSETDSAKGKADNK